MNDIRNNLVRIRKEKGISQRELAKRVGMTQAAINHFETGKRNLNINSLYKLAAGLNVPVCDFFPKSDYPTTSSKQLCEYFTLELIYELERREKQE